MKTFPTRLDFVTPPISVTRFDAGPAALRAHFVVLAASADAAVRGVSKSRAARRPLQRRGEQVPPAPQSRRHRIGCTEDHGITADTQFDHFDELAYSMP